MELLIPLLLAAAVTVALVPLLERRAIQLKVMDSPGERKLHESPVPRVGGIAMAAGAAAAFAFWLPPSRQALAFIAGASVVFLLGLWDDRRDLKPGVKFLGQFIAVSIVVFFGEITIHSISLSGRIELPGAFALPLTFLFLVGVTNAINLADGLDGLAGGTTLLIFATIAALCIGYEATFVITVACVMIGSLLGFLRFNSYPARIFMGDSGSELLGFSAGVLAVAVTQDDSLPFSAGLPLLLLGLPILDTLIVMVRRLSRGQSPFKADTTHLHHRLLARGFDHFEAVAIIYVLQAALLVLAWNMRFVSDVRILAAFAIIAAVTVLLLYLGRRTRWQWRGPASGLLEELLAERVPWLKAPTRIPRWGNAIAWCCVAIYLLGVSLSSTVISPDVAWLALGMSLIFVAALARLLPDNLMERLAHGAVFVGVVMAVYLDHVEPTSVPAFTLIKKILFPVLIVAIALRMRFWRERRFEATPLDVLVVVLALVLPNLPGLRQGPSNIGISVIKVVLLLYAVEMLLGHSERVKRWTWGVSGLAAGLFAFRGLFQMHGQ